MTIAKRFYWVAALVAVFALAAVAVTLSSQLSSADSATGEAARLDDGKELLPQAGITIDQAIAAAQAAAANPGASDGDGEAADDSSGDNTAADPNNTDGETNDDGDTVDDHADGETNDGPADGVVGEIDLEDSNGTLAFNVEIGAHDVKVDASNGAVLGMGSD
jgi:uncharacterized membrane protein YkoI